MHLVPVLNYGYQLVIVNNMHEALIYKDHFGALPDDQDASEAQTDLNSNLHLLARVPVP